MPLHLRPHLLMKISGDPFLLQRLLLEAEAETLVFIRFVWAKQLGIDKSRLSRNRWVEDTLKGLLKSVFRRRF